MYRWLGCKLIYVPSGCLDTETKENFSKLDGGHVCNNCGFPDGVCDDKKNNAKFDVIRRYMHMNVHGGSFLSSQYIQTFFKYKSQNFDLWNPNIVVPDKFKLPPTNNIRILHGFQSHNGARESGGKNIKGSPFIQDAVDRLKAEGYAVELIYLTNVHQKDMRFYQMQADVIVEQLIIGWWGSTGIETMSLGKPVICYLRPAWKEHFFKVYPEYQNQLPIIEANTKNIYDVLKKVIEDQSYREQKGRESWAFAQKHFDPKQNVPKFITLLESL